MSKLLPEIKLTEFLYYRPEDDDLMVVTYDAEQIQRFGITAVSFERCGIPVFDLMRPLIFEAMLEHSGWHLIGEV